jgi:hypothetical protein
MFAARGHNVGVHRALPTLNEGGRATYRVVGERTEIASAAHADWARGGSRILEGKRAFLAYSAVKVGFGC